jgi:hypothetical protein
VTNSSADAFSLDLTLRHETATPDVITAALGMQPIYSWAAGEACPGGAHNETHWRCTVEHGSGVENFDLALRNIAVTLKRHDNFFKSLVDTGGEVEIAINFHAAPESVTSCGGEETASQIFDLTLYPDFIAVVAAVPAALRISLWQ